MEEPDVPDFPGWSGEADHEPEACMQAVMRLDPETRIFQVVLEGPAGWILEFLRTNEEGSMIEKLQEEAIFDQITQGFSGSPDDDDQQVDQCD